MWESSFVCLLLFDSWETDCVWFGKLLFGIPPESGSARLGHIPSLPGKPQLPLKPCVSLQPVHFKGTCGFCDSLLDFKFLSSIPLLRRAACPPFLKDALPFCPFGTFPHTVGNHPPRRAEPARPQLPAARILQPLSISPIFRQFTQLKLSIHQIKCLFFCLLHNFCKRWL